MHQSPRAQDLAAEHMADALMPQTHAQQRNRRPKPANHIARNARLVRRAGAGRNADALGLERGDCVERDLVVPLHEHLGPQLAEVLDEVVGERVVVIYDEQHGGELIPAPRERQRFGFAGCE